MLPDMLLVGLTGTMMELLLPVKNLLLKVLLPEVLILMFPFLALRLLAKMVMIFSKLVAVFIIQSLF